MGPPRVCVAAQAAENLVVQPAFSSSSSSSRKLYYYTVYRGKEKTAAAENTIPPGVRKSMVGRRRVGSPAVADARTPPPPRTGDPFDRNSTHTPARTFIPTGRRIVTDAATAEFPTPLFFWKYCVVVYDLSVFRRVSQCLFRRTLYCYRRRWIFTGRSESPSQSVACLYIHNYTDHHL